MVYFAHRFVGLSQEPQLGLGSQVSLMNGESNGGMFFGSLTLGGVGNMAREFKILLEMMSFWNVFPVSGDYSVW